MVVIFNLLHLITLGSRISRQDGPNQTRRHVTALSALQHRLLALLQLPSTIYTQLCGDSLEPP